MEPADLDSWVAPNRTELPAIAYSVSLSFRALRDIPQQLFDNDLSPVNDLSLARNPLKSLPETITKFSNLKSLNLASTELSELPEMISALSRLTQISLAINSIACLSDGFFRLTNLHEVNLMKNELTSLSPHWTSLQLLRVVNLRHNRLSSIQPLSYLPLLETLNVSNNALESVPTLSHLTALVSLNLSENRIIVFGWDSVPSTLTELNLANNQLAFIPNPPLLERLASLDISYNDLTAATLSEQFFRSLPHLTTLDISGNDIEGKPAYLDYIDFVDNEVKVPDRIIPGLFLGCFESSKNKHLLRRLMITHVLTLFTCHHLAVDDMPYVQLSTYFKECIEFIDEGRKQGGVLVHCLAGVSRSATVVIAYLMHHKSIGVEEAYLARPIVNPNPGFMNQLYQWEKLVRSRSLAPRVLEKKNEKRKHEA